MALSDQDHMNMFGCTAQDWEDYIVPQIKLVGPHMLAASILSDAQELLHMNAEGNAEQVRQYLNRSKKIIFDLAEKDHPDNKYRQAS